ncbi:MAG: helix-turn-helix transcriptional regulator [Clostridia bacterium]
MSNFNADIDTHISERLKYYRHKNCYLQSDIAKILGISAKCYKTYENISRDYYDTDKLQILADLYEIHITDLLDEYNLFLYNGQGEQICKKRQAMNLSQLEFGKLLGVGRRAVGKWENDESVIFKDTWERILGVE